MKERWSSNEQDSQLQNKGTQYADRAEGSSTISNTRNKNRDTFYGEVSIVSSAECC